MKNYLNARFDFESKELLNTYDELPLWSAPFGLKLLEKIPYKHNLNVLDIGCCVGFPMLELAQRLGKSSTVYGLDPWKSALEQIRYKANIYRVQNIQCINGDANHLPFQSDFFDLIVSNNGINNTGNEQQTLQECFRVCKPKGQLIFTVNLPETMIEFYRIFQKILEQNALNERIPVLHAHIHQHRKSVEELKLFATNAGFRIIDVDMDQFAMRFCDGSAMLNHHFIKMYFLQPWKDVVGKEKMIETFDRLEEKLNTYAKENNGLQLSIPYVCITCEK